MLCTGYMKRSRCCWCAGSSGPCSIRRIFSPKGRSKRGRSLPMPSNLICTSRAWSRVLGRESRPSKGWLRQTRRRHQLRRCKSQQHRNIESACANVLRAASAIFVDTTRFEATFLHAMNDASNAAIANLCSELRLSPREHGEFRPFSKPSVLAGTKLAIIKR